MNDTEALRAALQAAREARNAVPMGTERSALNVALDRLDVALSTAAALAPQPAASGEPVAEIIRQFSGGNLAGVTARWLVDAAMLPHGALLYAISQPATAPAAPQNKWIADVYRWIESTCPPGAADEAFRVAPQEVREAFAAAHGKQSHDYGERGTYSAPPGRVGKAPALSPQPAPALSKGLTVQAGDDGVWLSFSASTGRHASLNVERIADSHGGIVSNALHDWAADVAAAKGGAS